MPQLNEFPIMDDLLGQKPDIDIDRILEIVKSGEADGLRPDQLLDDDELMAYGMRVMNNTPMVRGHYDNLAPIIESSELARLATDIIDWVACDEKSREAWAKREREGIRLLGVSDNKDDEPPFKGASTVTHPLLIEAVTEFHARSIAEMWPPDGIVKTIVLGDQTPERLAQAERVKDYMNYQYMEDMPGAFEEEDSLLFRLPLSGSCFKKVYFDSVIGKICTMFIEPSDFIVPFAATNLESAARFTHRYRLSRNMVLKYAESGFFVQSDRIIGGTMNESFDYPVVKDEIDSTEGRHRVTTLEDSRVTILEMYVDLELKSIDDSTNGIALPYIVWISRDHHEVLRIQRNWEPNDSKKHKMIPFAHYKFMPGLGFYGYGLLHLIGGLAKSATGTLRALLDSAAFANMQGGYRTRDSRVKGGDVPLAPGEWREVDISAEELSKAFFKVPYEEPSQTLFNLLGYLDNASEKFTGNAVLTGDANPNAPVGTTLALIEQGGKTFSSIHRRLHVAHKNEFRILAKLNYMYLPDGGYPYYTKSGDKHIMPSDFDDRIDVVPVSDPGIISNAQRISQAQAILDLATKYPTQVNIKEALKTMLTVLRVQNIDALLQDDQAAQQHQQQLMQLELQHKQAEIDKLKADKERIDAQKVELIVQSIFEAIQAAVQSATNSAVVPIADMLLKSAGFKDNNGGTLIDGATMPQSQLVNSMPVPENTSPGLPPVPQQAEPMSADALPPDPPETGEAGIGAGIEGGG